MEGVRSIMFCPSCGSEENQLNQYCRVCGANLNSVRVALEKPEEITASAISARDEIGRAVAAKIKETQSVSELRQVTWELLPVVAEFLESPAEKQSKREEKRLERIRSGVITTSVGLGITLLFLFVSLTIKPDALLFAPIGLLVFLIGLGIVINGLVFSVARKNAAEQSTDADRQKLLAQLSGASKIPPVQFASPERKTFSSSVTEHTTHQLSDKPAMMRPFKP